jgi:hypothetical protein
MEQSESAEQNFLDTLLDDEVVVPEELYEELAKLFEKPIEDGIGNIFFGEETVSKEPVQDDH